MTGDFPMGIGAGPSRLKRMSCQRLLFIRIISGIFIIFGLLAEWNNAVPDTRYIFQRRRLFSNKPIDLGWDLRIHSFSYSKIRPLSLCFHVENSLQMKMKRWQSGLVPVPGEKSLLNIWLATGSPGVRKKGKSTTN